MATALTPKTERNGTRDATKFQAPTKRATEICNTLTGGWRQTRTKMKIVDAKKLLNKEKNVVVVVIAVVVFGLICIRIQKIFILDSFGLCVCVCTSFSI